MLYIPSYQLPRPDATEYEVNQTRNQSLAALDRCVPASHRLTHPELKAAVEHYEKARHEEKVAHEAHAQAEQTLPDAERRDEEALADAAEQGKPDPGPKHREAQERAIQAAKRQHGASRIALARSVERVQQAFAEHSADWQRSLEQDRDNLRAMMSELLDGWQHLHGQLQTNSALRALARGEHAMSEKVYAHTFEAPRLLDGNRVYVEDVLAGLRDLAKPQTPNTQAAENVRLGEEPTRISEERRRERAARAAARTEASHE